MGLGWVESAQIEVLLTLISQSVTQTYQPQLYQQQQEALQQHQTSHKAPLTSSTSGGMAGLFDKVQGAVQHLGSDLKAKLSAIADIHSHTHASGQCHDGAHQAEGDNRFLSFAPQRDNNEVKWYVDGCGYMWAVSMALEQAKETIWILDCKT
jgi:phospholipase D1/2